MEALKHFGACRPFCKLVMGLWDALLAANLDISPISPDEAPGEVKLKILIH